MTLNNGEAPAGNPRLTFKTMNTYGSKILL